MMHPHASCLSCCRSQRHGNTVMQSTITIPPFYSSESIQSISHSMLTYAPCWNSYKRKTSINDVRWDDRDVTQVYASLNDGSAVGGFNKGNRIVVDKLIQKVKYMGSGYKEIWNDNKRSMVDQATAEHVPKRTKSQWGASQRGVKRRNGVIKNSKAV